MIAMFTVDDLVKKHYPNVMDKPWLLKSTCFFLRYILKEKEINYFEQEYPHLQGLDFVEQLLEHFLFSYSTRDNEKEHIPSEGQVVIIANNPIGSLDGLALIKLVSQVRRDIKVVANNVLMSIKPLSSMLIPVDTSNDSLTLHDANQHLKNEGVLLIFPAAEVSRLKPQGVRDSRWGNLFLRIASSTQAPILPIFLDGKNSPLFYTASMLYKPLASLLLVREMVRQRTKHLPMRIGGLISYDSYNLDHISNQQKVKLLKKELYRLAKNKPPIFNTQKAIAPPEDRQRLSQEIKQCEKLGTTNDNKEIYLYSYKGSSSILREIGRLREIAFRMVGEGTNKRRDIDVYDNHYYHLILWDNEDLEIVGAYRFGDAKKLTQDENKLYSSSLVHYNETMQPYFDKGLELGRSFVQPKYWGKRSLDYLWFGIGAFLKSRPQYRYLFGPVSLSSALPTPAKELIICFYQQYFGHPSNLAVANSPYQLSAAAKDVFCGNNYKEDFIKLKTMLSNMGVAIPTLYKQYTEIYEPGGVSFVSFGIDTDFNNCIDGLVLADLTMLKAKKRQRYMGD